MWAAARSASMSDMSNFVSRRALPWACAIALHIVLVLFASYLIAPPRDFLKQEPPLQQPFAVVQAPSPYRERYTARSLSAFGLSKASTIATVYPTPRAVFAR